MPKKTEMTRREKYVLKSFTLCSVLMFTLTLIVTVLYNFNIYIHNDKKEMLVLIISLFSFFILLSFLCMIYAFILIDKE
nr:MAG TPA: FAM70 protein [Caudoviricetes sp.]